MNIELLKYFLSVYDLKNLSKAAKKLGITQSAISKNIQKLEVQLELKLFERHTRNVEPTDAAHLLYRHANQSVCAVNDFLDKARFLSQGDSGIIHIGCGPLAHALILNPLISTLLEKQSDIRIHARTEAFDLLKQGLDRHFYHYLMCDVGDLSMVTDPEEYQVTSLLEIPLYLVANKNHPVHTLQDWQKVFDYKWILPPVPPRYLNQMPKPMRNFLQRSDKPDFETTDLQQAVQLAKKNDLLTVATGKIMPDGTISNTGLKPVSLPFPLMTNIGLWRIRSRLLTPQMREIIDLLPITDR